MQKKTFMLAFNRDFNDDNVECNDIGEMDVVCKGCGALHFRFEKQKGLNKCCQNGKVCSIFIQKMILQKNFFFFYSGFNRIE